MLFRSRRIRDRARREAQSVEQRQTLLQRRRERLNAESGEERDVRLQQMREVSRDRRANESSQQRAARLQQMRDHTGKSLCAGRHNEVQSKRRRTTEVLLKQLRLAPHHALHVTSYNCGEPERAPH